MPQYKKVFDVGTYAGVSGFTRVGIPTLRTPGSGGKQVAKSLRFRSANTAYLSRTPGSAGTSRRIFTWSAWVKRGSLSTRQALFSAGAVSTTPSGSIYFTTTNDNLEIIGGGGAQYQLVTTQVFRDISTWSHILVAFDTTQATSSNRIKLYVNGRQVTAFSTATYPSLNFDTDYSNSVLTAIGSRTDDGSPPVSTFDGYMSEVYFIDGTALDPTSFGEYNSDNIWVPKAYSGSFAGTNSFYLDFSDVGTTTAGGANTGYGKDLSGKGTPNNWTTNNFGTTSTLATYDSMYDSPTDYDNSVYGAGNYATLNPLINGTLSTISEANLKASNTTGYDVVGTLWATTKCYYEYIITNTAAATTPALGMGDPAIYLPATNNLQNVNGAFAVRKDGVVFVNGSNAGTYTSFTTGDIVGFAFDPATGKFWYHVNGVWVNSGNPTAGTGQAGTATVGYKYVPVINLGLSSAIVTLNCGQQPFRGVYVSGSGSSYTGTGAPPSGFSALNTKNITRPTDANMWFYGDTPDLVWIKNRTATADHSLTDTVRGVGLGMSSNQATAEQGAQDVAEMNKFGMTLIGASSRTTAASNNFVYWAWKGGGTTPTTGTGTGGITNVQYSANVSSGFSVVTYTGSGAAGTVTHGLGVAPVMILNKARNAAYNWHVYFSTLGTGDFEGLNTTSAYSSASNWFNNAAVNSTTFPVGASQGTSNYVCYCFAPIAGYSAFGSYTGNGSTDGPFIYTGFRPRWIMIKNSTANSVTAYGSWKIIDTARSTYNAANPSPLWANGNYQEDLRGNGGSNTATLYNNILSNGFKLGTAASYEIETNESGVTYIYAAFAEVPFKIARAR